MNYISKVHKNTQLDVNDGEYVETTGNTWNELGQFQNFFFVIFISIFIL